MAVLFYCLSAFPAHAENALTEHYGSASLGITFDYSPEWTIVPCGVKDVVCSLKVQPRAAPAAKKPIAYIMLTEGSLEQAAENSFFTKEGNKWILQGRFAPEPALLFSLPAGQALSGTATCGDEVGDDEHIKNRRCFYGIASNGKRAVSVETDGDFPGTFESLRAMVSTIRFLPGV